MYTWIFKRVGWKFFAAGAATAYFAGGFVRPALVSTVKAALSAKDAAAGVWNQAKTETASVLAEASHLHATESSVAGDVVGELRKLREDVAAMKAQLAGRES
jgi:hypothetical protein